MRVNKCCRRVALMAACCLVFTVEAAHAQLPSIRFRGPEPSVFEGNPGGPAVTLIFTVELSSVSNQDVTALFSTSLLDKDAVSGTSCTPFAGNPDFIGVTNHLVTIPAGTDPPTTTVPVTVCPDTRVEFHQNFANQTREDFVVSLTSPTNAYCIGIECLSAGHIFDDDGIPFALIDSVTTREPFSGTKTATFTVTLSHPHPGFEVKVGWATRNGTTRGGAGCGPFITGGYADYRTGSGTLVFPPNTTSQTIQVTICSDPVDEDTQTYFVDLTNQLNADVVSPGTGSILDFQPLFTGTPALVPDNAEVEAREWLTYNFGWTVTNGVWRDLKTMELRVVQRGTRKIALWIRWVESANTVQLCHGPDDSDNDEDSKRWTGHRDPHSEKARCGPPVVAGSPQILHAALGRLDVAGAKTIGSGPTGPSVTLQLPVSFKRGAAHHTYDVEVAAESDAGVRDDFMPAGVLVVRR